uniref:Uncharacterized protein n=1 Tax=Parastrongyloides trichosuri TaxID=131310 RepID=A0A0N4Z032_PARTI
MFVFSLLLATISLITSYLSPYIECIAPDDWNKNKIDHAKDYCLVNGFNIPESNSTTPEKFNQIQIITFGPYNVHELVELAMDIKNNKKDSEKYKQSLGQAIVSIKNGLRFGGLSNINFLLHPWGTLYYFFMLPFTRNNYLAFMYISYKIFQIVSIYNINIIQSYLVANKDPDFGLKIAKDWMINGSNSDLKFFPTLVTCKRNPYESYKKTVVNELKAHLENDGIFLFKIISENVDYFTAGTLLEYTFPLPLHITFPNGVVDDFCGGEEKDSGKKKSKKPKLSIKCDQKDESEVDNEKYIFERSYLLESISKPENSHKKMKSFGVRVKDTDIEFL